MGLTPVLCLAIQRMNRQLWQRLYDLHRFQRYRDHTQNEIEDVVLIPHILGKSVVVVGNAGFLVDTNAAALHYPIKCRLAIDHILLRLQWDARNGDAVVVVDRGLVLGSIALFTGVFAVDAWRR